jgi:hypothetical protein
MRIGAVWIGGGAIVIGLLAGVFLDRFWDGLKDYRDWLWPW